ncbi:MAG TPA: S-layer homology domain-containing protein [Spirochaetia bacterium]|nr:S-layer homology domain-containing protein [Spirochaetia bacterium]
MRRFVLIVFLALLTVVTVTYPAGATPVRFTDVPASFWAAPAIGTLAGEGIVHGFPNGSFAPGNPVTRAQFAGMVDAALHLAPYDPPTPTFRDVPRTYWGYGVIETAVQAGIIHGTGAGSFGPDRPITRQDMAVILSNALQLTTVTQDLAGSPASFRDNTAIAGYAVGAVVAANRLQLMKGQPDGRFEPGYNASRAQAAQVIYGLMNLAPQAVSTLEAGLAQGIAIAAPPSPLVPGQTIDVTATVYDGQGHLLPVQPAWSSTDGTITAAGVFTANQPGPAVITAALTNSTGLLQTSTTVLVASGSSLNGPPGTLPPTPTVAGLAIAAPNPAAIPAGGTLTVNVQVKDNLGDQLSSDQGRQITLKVTSPSYHNDTYTATDAGGGAVFTVSGTVAGTYSMQASSSGLASSAGATFQVEPGLPDHLQLVASPSTLVVPGRPAQITAAIVDAYGNPTTTASPIVLTANSSRYGTFLQANHNVAGNTVLGTFIPNGQTGTTTFTLTAPGTSYGSATLTLSSLPSTPALVAGKGMWLLYGDWQNIPDDQLIATAQADHITHLYVEVAATATAFYGKPALADLLPKAHAAHIALVAWIYTSLGDPAQDAALATQVADFRTAGGDAVDGVAVDLEENLDPGNISAFAVPTQQALGQNYLLVAVVYPPQSNPGQTYASMYKAVSDFSVLATMDYWHNTQSTFTTAQVSQYVTQSLQMLPALTGNPALPVEVIGQAYNMFTSGDYAPSGTEELTAMAAARAGGATAYSMYRWGTASPAEWQAFANYNW